MITFKQYITEGRITNKAILRKYPNLPVINNWSLHLKYFYKDEDKEMLYTKLDGVQKLIKTGNYMSKRHQWLKAETTWIDPVTFEYVTNLQDGTRFIRKPAATIEGEPVWPLQ